MANMRSVVMSTILSTLFVLTYSMVACAMNQIGESSSAFASTPSECAGQFKQIYAQFVDHTPGPSSPEALELLEKAINLHETTMNREDKQKCHEEMLDIGDLHYLITNADCVKDALEFRATRAAKFSDNGYKPKLIEFVTFHNNERFQHCKTQIESQIQEALRAADPQPRQDRLTRLLEFIRESSGGRFRETSFSQDVVTGFNNYLKSTGFPMGVPAGVPLSQHLDDVENELQATINADCHPTLNDLAQLLFDGQVIVSLADKLKINLNWSESLMQIMQLASICNIIKEVGTDLYLVGNYNVDSNVLYNTASDAPFDTTQVAQVVADMLRYYQGRQALLDEEHPQEINDLNSLASLQNLDREHCQTTNMAMINELHNRSRDNTNLRNYIEQYGQRLLVICMPIFERELRNRVRNYPNGFRVRIAQIHSNMEDIMARGGTPMTNRSVIPRRVFLSAFSQFLSENGLPILEDPHVDQATMISALPIVDTLILIPCSDMLTGVGQEFIAFMSELSELDRLDPTPFTQESEDWINVINICKAIAGL